MNELTHFDAARRELMLASTIDEVMQIRDKAEALKAYIRQSGESHEMQNAMAEIKLRAERKAGELITEGQEKGEIATKKTNQYNDSDTVSLSDIGLSKKQSSRFKQIANIPEPEFEEYIEKTKASETGEVTSAAALRLSRQINRPEFESPPPPIGKFRIIYADPPWRYEHSKTTSRDIENQYPTMTLEQICLLPIADLADKDCILFLWATSPKLAEALQVMDSWGFTYRTCMVWVKDKIGMGYYARQQHELLLIGKVGNMYAPEPENRQSSVVMSPRGKHSEKPAEFYGIIETMYPEESKIELFARTEKPGWKMWGNQL